MNRDEAIRVLARYWPCPHTHYDNSLGLGKVWGQCHDCGDTFRLERLPAIRAAAQAFGDAVDALQESGPYAKLAQCMGCAPEEIPGLIQKHAPWSGRPLCDDALRERVAVVAYLHDQATHMARDHGDHEPPCWSEIALQAAALHIERGAHHPPKETP